MPAPFANYHRPQRLPPYQQLHHPMLSKRDGADDHGDATYLPHATTPLKMQTATEMMTAAAAEVTTMAPTTPAAPRGPTVAELVEKLGEFFDK